MKVYNKHRISNLIRNYLLGFLGTSLVGTLSFLFLCENQRFFGSYLPEKIFSYSIYNVVGSVIDITLPSFIVLFLFHIWKVYSKEYIVVWKDFVEGPTEKGERRLFSFSQVKYIGRDIFGRFTIKSDLGEIVLPGNLTKLDTLELEKELKRARLQNNL